MAEYNQLAQHVNTAATIILGLPPGLLPAIHFTDQVPAGCQRAQIVTTAVDIKVGPGGAPEAIYVHPLEVARTADLLLATGKGDPANLLDQSAFTIILGVMSSQAGVDQFSPELPPIAYSAAMAWSPK
jgi:hypothetical protein